MNNTMVKEFEDSVQDKPVPGQQWRLKSDPSKVLAVKWVSHGIVGYSDAYWRERTYGTRRLDLFLKWFELVG